MKLLVQSAAAPRAGIRITSSAAALAIALLSGPALAAVAVNGQAGTPPQTSDTTTPSTTDQAATAAPDATVAQQDGDGEIVVTGIRASLQSAAGRKRDSAIVQDSITQEDLGKFPDANVAESLQRIPGVAIDRSNGEGQFVTVRGLGPEFNTVLFNGRSFASDNYGRAFSFDLLAAELISGADVYKTSQARVQDGGIGATINLRTSRPLDLNGFRAIATAKGNYEPNSKKTTPQLFGLLSDTFADGTIGILGSVSYQKRIANIRSVYSEGYLPNQQVGPTAAPLLNGQRVYAPRNLNVNSTTDRRSRLGLTLVGQYRPSDQLTVTVDGLYNKFKSDQTSKALGLWFEPSALRNVQVDANRTVTSLTTTGNADMIDGSGVRDTDTYQIGANADFRPNDDLRVVFDVTKSRARNNGAGKGYFTVAGVPTSYTYTAGGPGELPSITNFTAGSLTNAAAARTHLASNRGNNVQEDVVESKFDTEWKANGTLSAVRFGASYTNRKRQNQGSGTLNVSCLYCGYNTLADPSLFTTVNVGKVGSSGNIPTTFLQYDPDAYLAYLSTPAALNALDVALGRPVGTSARQLQTDSEGNGFRAVLDPADFVRERVYAAYVEADLEGDVGGLPWFLNVGARYVHTELTSRSQSRQLIDLLPVQNDPGIYNPVFLNGNRTIPVTASNSYDAFLPDFNLKINLAPRVNLRFAGSETLTRPALGDLRPATSIDVARPVALQSSGGNPNLQPYRSTNLDASLEWYPTPTTTLSAALFYKNIKDFIVTTLEPEPTPILNNGNLPVGGLITGRNEATFTASRPRNADAADVRGVELNVVHTFDWAPGILSGFGTQVNATFVSTNRGFDEITATQRFAIVGIGNSQNFTLFYEKFGISARIAYNRRERFLQSIANGYGSEPLFVRNYGQFDASASYDVTPFAQVFVEGTNLFNAKYVTVARFDNQLRSFNNYGSRFNAGFRLRF